MGWRWARAGLPAGVGVENLLCPGPLRQRCWPLEGKMGGTLRQVFQSRGTAHKEAPRQDPREMDSEGGNVAGSKCVRGER